MLCYGKVVYYCYVWYFECFYMFECIVWAYIVDGQQIGCVVYVKVLQCVVGFDFGVGGKWYVFVVVVLGLYVQCVQ